MRFITHKKKAVYRIISMTVILSFMSMFFSSTSKAYANYETNMSRFFDIKIEKNSDQIGYKATLLSNNLVTDKMDNFVTKLPTYSRNEIRCRIYNLYGEIVDTRYFINPVCLNYDAFSEKNLSIDGQVNNSLIQSNSSQVQNKKEIFENMGMIGVVTKNSSDLETLLVDVRCDDGKYRSIGKFSIKPPVSEKISSLAPPLAPQENDPNLVKLLYNGEDSSKLVLAILADGYTANEQDKFIEDAKRAIGGIMTTKPFSDYIKNINIYAIKQVSKESGVSRAGNSYQTNKQSLSTSNSPNSAKDTNSSNNEVIKDTSFGSMMNYDGEERAIVATKKENVYNVLRKYVPAYDAGIVLANTEKYGGTSSDIITITAHSLASQVLLHELGHLLGALADEYAGGQNVEKANCSQEKNPEKVKWKSYIGKEGVSIYTLKSDSGKDTGWYRPSQKCKMAVLSDDFCPVCRDVLTMRLINESKTTENKGNISSNKGVNGTGKIDSTSNTMKGAQTGGQLASSSKQMISGNGGTNISSGGSGGVSNSGLKYSSGGSSSTGGNYCIGSGKSNSGTKKIYVGSGGSKTTGCTSGNNSSAQVKSSNVEYGGSGSNTSVCGSTSASNGSKTESVKTGGSESNSVSGSSSGKIQESTNKTQETSNKLGGNETSGVTAGSKNLGKGMGSCVFGNLFKDICETSESQKCVSNQNENKINQGNVKYSNVSENVSKGIDSTTQNIQPNINGNSSICVNNELKQENKTNSQINESLNTNNNINSSNNSLNDNEVKPIENKEVQHQNVLSGPGESYGGHIEAGQIPQSDNGKKVDIGNIQNLNNSKIIESPNIVTSEHLESDSDSNSNINSALSNNFLQGNNSTNNNVAALDSNNGIQDKLNINNNSTSQDTSFATSNINTLGNVNSASDNSLQDNQILNNTTNNINDNQTNTLSSWNNNENFAGGDIYANNTGFGEVNANNLAQGGQNNTVENFASNWGNINSGFGSGEGFGNFDKKATEPAMSNNSLFTGMGNSDVNIGNTAFVDANNGNNGFDFGNTTNNADILDNGFSSFQNNDSGFTNNASNSLLSNIQSSDWGSFGDSSLDNGSAFDNSGFGTGSVVGNTGFDGGSSFDNSGFNAGTIGGGTAFDPGTSFGTIGGNSSDTGGFDTGNSFGNAGFDSGSFTGGGLSDIASFSDTSLAPPIDTDYKKSDSVINRAIRFFR